MKINPYLAFDGNCREAFAYYQKHLDGQILMMLTNGESPIANEMPDDRQDKIMHARMVISGDQVLMGGDAPTGQYDGMKGCMVSINVDDASEAERIFAALSDGGNVMMPIGETFWAKRFGMAYDQFGVSWMVNCEKPMEK